MFAFCPKINQKDCGTYSGSDKIFNMAIKAKPHVQNVTTQMKYSTITSKGLHDACYYEIGTFPIKLLRPFLNDTYEKYGLRIHVQVTKNVNVNAYVYGGSSRSNATISIISGNEMMETKTNYTIDYTDGLVIVAYPDQPDMPTEFEYQYWIGPYDGSFWDRMANLDFSGKDGELYLLAFLGLILGSICVLCCCCYCIRKFIPKRTQIGV
jgi:hypothetical protein